MKPRGGAGWLATAGMAVGIVVWWPIAAAAGGSWFVLAMRGYRRSHRAMAFLEAALDDATRTVRLTPYDEIDGKLRDLPFKIRNGVKTLHVLISTLLPTGITIDRLEPKLPIGDPEFDAKFRVYADDGDTELAWRWILTHELRASFCNVFGKWSVVLREGWFDIVIEDDDADGAAIERLVREGNALGLALAKRLEGCTLEAFVEQIPREPTPKVRMSHYEWLVTGGYEVPALLHLASKDSHPEIRNWANSQRPSETMYR